LFLVVVEGLYIKQVLKELTRIQLDSKLTFGVLEFNRNRLTLILIMYFSITYSLKVKDNCLYQN